MQNVLIVIDQNSVLFHAGDPVEFSSELIVEYAKKGYTIATVTLDKFKELGIYQPVKVDIFNPLK